MIYARWAVLGTLGCLTLELLAKYASVQLGEPMWFKADARSPSIRRPLVAQVARLQ